MLVSILLHVNELSQFIYVISYLTVTIPGDLSSLLCLHDLLLELRDTQLHLSFFLDEFADVLVLVGDGLPPLLETLPDDLTLALHVRCQLAVDRHLGGVRGQGLKGLLVGLLVLLGEQF